MPYPLARVSHDAGLPWPRPVLPRQFEKYLPAAKHREPTSTIESNRVAGLQELLRVLQETQEGWARKAAEIREAPDRASLMRLRDLEAFRARLRRQYEPPRPAVVLFENVK